MPDPDAPPLPEPGSAGPAAAPVAVSAAQEPAADIARRVAQELNQLSSITSRIECAIAGLMLDSPGIASGLHRDLQSLDSLGQMLEALAQFLTDMATQIPADWTFDPTHAASSLKLRDLANRLANKQESPSGQAAECDFF